jgi:hypothetical protein
LETLDVLGVKDKENIQPSILQVLGMINVSLPSSQARIEINSSHVNNGLLVDEFPNLEKILPLPEKQVDEIPMKLIFEQCFYK